MALRRRTRVREARQHAGLVITMPSPNPFLAAFHQGLKENGYEGKNVLMSASFVPYLFAANATARDNSPGGQIHN
jgi:hypothetical protein